MITLAQLKTNAASQVAKYPQYANHFDNVGLARVVKPTKTKFGVMAEKDETVLYFKGEDRIVDEGPNKGKLFKFIWSMAHGIKTSVPANSIVEI